MSLVVRDEPGDRCGKHDRLTVGELDQFRLHRMFMSLIESQRQRLGVDQRELRILDWGCGRGRAVIWLRRMGYQAYGVDVDPVPVEHGAAMAAAAGGSSGALLALLDGDGCAPFPAGSFDVIISDQVLEHVRDLAAVSAEMARLTANRGVGLHCFPAYRVPVEPHLFMPFVHWLPKTGIRRRMIAACLRIGMDPGWRELSGASVSERAAVYYRYSVDKTFYRHPTVVRGVFNDAGLEARFVPSRGRVVAAGSGRLEGTRTSLPDRLALFLSVHFRNSWLLVSRNA